MQGLRYGLPDRVRMVEREGEIVFLDIARGRYECVLDAAAVRVNSRGEIVVDDEHLASDLREAHLIAVGGRPAQLTQLTAARDLKDEPPPALRWTDLVRLGGAYWQALRHYYGRGFCHIVERALSERSQRGRRKEAWRAAPWRFGACCLTSLFRGCAFFARFSCASSYEATVSR